MRRREFIAALGGATAWPLVVRSEDRMIRRIGILMNFASGDAIAAARLSAFMKALESLGWAEGRSIHLETRWSEGDPQRMRKDAAELVALSPDVILATTTPAAMLVKRATNTVPIIFVGTTDPVGAGLVASLSRPHGNATGFMAFEYTLAAKWLELLKEIVPRVTRTAVLRDSSTPTGIGLFAAIQTVSPIGMELSVIDVSDPIEMEREVAAFAHDPNGGLIVTPSTFGGAHTAVIVESAARNKLPAIYPSRYFVTVGGLMSYGATLYDEYRAAAGYVDRILRGTKPSDLPVQAPTKYELVINLKTAKALDIMVLHSLLARADEVIE